MSDLALSSVPFSFGSDMGDDFIVPCGACRQVMREVTACMEVPLPRPPAIPLTPAVFSPNHPEVPRWGLQPPPPGLAAGSSNCTILQEKGPRRVGAQW